MPTSAVIGLVSRSDNECHCIILLVDLTVAVVCFAVCYTLMAKEWISSAKITKKRGINYG
jgi:hypothetical protein